MKKIKCKVCECEFIPEKKAHYIARANDKTGIVATIQSNDEPDLFDAFDCPQCGCQAIMQERKRIMEDVEDEAEESDDNESI